MDTAVGVPVVAVANGVPVVAVANGKLTADPLTVSRRSARLNRWWADGKGCRLSTLLG